VPQTIKKRVPIDLTIPEWRELCREFPGVPLAQLLRRAFDIGIAQIRQTSTSEKETVS